MEQNDARLEVAQEAGVVETDESFEQLFNNTRLLGTNAIPVPPSLGERIKKHYQATIDVYKSYHDDWRASIDAFTKDGSVEDFERTGTAKDNFVRQVVQSLIDFTYMRNPTAEFTANRTEDEAAVTNLSKILSIVISKSGIHGVNLRSYVQRQIITTHLTNHGPIKLDYTPEVGSREDAMKLYEVTKQKLKTVDNPADAEYLYQLLDRLSKEMANRRPMGLQLKNVSPFMFYADPKTTKDDLSDSRFCFELENIDEDFLKSEYMSFLEDDKTWRFRYDENQIFDGRQSNHRVNNESAKAAIIDELMPEATDKEIEYEKENTILCVWWHDRITKQKYLYIVDRWDTPLWVYEDELKLSRFFPYFLMAFSPSVGNILRKSEASYYIPHQRELNKTAENFAMIKNNVFSTMLYNSNTVDIKEVEKVLTELRKPMTHGIRAIGINMKNPEATIDKMFTAAIPPVTAMPEFFSPQRNTQSIERMSRMSPAVRGEQFKTNTTNDAVAVYQQASETQFSAITDLVEETVGQLMWAIVEVIVSKYPKDYVIKIAGEKIGAQFRNQTVEEFNTDYVMTIEAGSTEKPSSDNKKREAVQIIQMLGQFGKAAPMTIISIVSRLLRNVFSKHLVSDDDLATLKEEGTAAMQKGVSTDQTQPPQGQ